MPPVVHDVDLRILVPGDEPLLEAFLAQHADSSLFLRANVRAAGLEDRGQPLHGTYAAAFVHGRIEGVVGHAWQGNLLLQAPRHGPALARRAAAASGRPVKGVLGPWAQVVEVRDALGLGRARLESRDLLYALDLGALRVPGPLAAGRLTCARAREEDLPLLAAWRHDFRVEALREPAGPALQAEAHEEVRRECEAGRHFVLREGQAPVAACAFNAQLPDCVQLGGVWTPPALRGRGYGRAVVAGALLLARREGVERSVLFTDEGDPAAQAAYRVLGYAHVGDYGLVLF